MDRVLATVRFYRLEEPLGCFSNFSPHPIVVNGVKWPTSEHYFQAQKFAATSHAYEIRAASTPGRAAELGRNRLRQLRSNWESTKDNVMRIADRTKCA